MLLGRVRVDELGHICMFLNATELCRVAVVNRTLRHISSLDQVAFFPSINLLNLSIHSTQLYLICLVCRYGVHYYNDNGVMPHGYHHG
jgi:hypothetical protein